ncbi:hypothetical protein ES707_11696 [subsurface metagenome]
MPVDIRCPRCGSETVIRTAKKGPKAGHRFHVCFNYPECKGKVPVSRLSFQQSKQINDLEWSDEKVKAYIAKETIDPEIVARVAMVGKKHYDQLDIWWKLTNSEKGDEIRDSFFNELKQEWPTEYSEISVEDVFHTVEEFLMNSIKTVFMAGYMFCKGWITLEEMSEWYLSLGDHLAAQIRATLSGAKSRGTAFAFAFAAVGVYGTLAASNTGVRTHEPSKYENNRKSVIGILLVPLAFPLMGAIPGAIIGLITGLFGFHLIAAIVIGIFIFITYPRSRRRWGSEPDLLTYFLALCGAAGGGFACYFVGNLLQ